MWAQSLLVLVIALFVAVSCQDGLRVVGGANTDIVKYPFMVSVRGPKGWHSCGGSVIASSWILTAAQCVSGLNPKQVSIQFATTVLGPASLFFMRVQRIIMHENYNFKNFYANDIALLQLKGQLLFTANIIGKVTLPQQNFEIPQSREGAPGTLIGWGATASGGIGMRHLQEAHLKIYSDGECSGYTNGRSTKDQICAGGRGKGQCSTDSGGPLLYEGSIQLGIVSMSRRPCASHPGVYTKVSHYVDWIHRNMNAN